MKKTFFLIAFLFVSLFASANEIETKTLVLSQTKEVETKEVTVSEEDESLELFVFFCITRTNYWYVETVMGMDKQLYDVYEVEETTTCYN
jgi:hypothetical protein